MKLCAWDLQMEFPVLRKRRLEVRPLRKKETYHNINLVNKPEFRDALSTCCQSYIRRTKCDAQRQHKCVWQGGMPSPCQLLPGRAGVQPAPKGHLAAASQSLLLLPTMFRKALGGLLTALQNITVLGCRKKNGKRFWQEANYMTSILWKINPSLPFPTNLSFLGLFLQPWISLTSSLSKSPK